MFTQGPFLQLQQPPGWFQVYRVYFKNREKDWERCLVLEGTEVPNIAHCIGRWYKQFAFLGRAGVSQFRAHPTGLFRGLGRPRVAATYQARAPGSMCSQLAAFSGPQTCRFPHGPHQCVGTGCLRDCQAPAGRCGDSQAAALTSPSGALRKLGFGNLAQDCRAACKLPAPPREAEAAAVPPPIGLGDPI